VMTGDVGDFQATIAPIGRALSDQRFQHGMTSLQESIHAISMCGGYVGNDTGMMHVAASFGLPTLGLFFMGEKSVIKSAPRWDEKALLQDHLQGDKIAITPAVVLEKMVEMGMV